MKKRKNKIMLGFLAFIIILIGLSVVIITKEKISNKKCPIGGINESRMVEINGSQQWISIYGEDLSNPVLLFLHGGPGSASSLYSYELSQKWGDVYTVVFWDQRNCGLSYSDDYEEIELSGEVFIEDGKEMVEFLLNYLGKEKLTLLGHSWGTIFGSNLVLAYPQYFDAYIGSGQVIDTLENEIAFKEAALQWTVNDSKMYELAQSLDPTDLSIDYFTSRNKLLSKYGHGISYKETDYSIIAAAAFCPYYSFGDYLTYLKGILKINQEDSAYLNFMFDGLQEMSLTDRYDYEVPYFNINGDLDYMANEQLAADYYQQVNAPYKQYYLMENTDHGLMLTHSEEFSKILHEIAETMKNVQ